VANLRAVVLDYYETLADLSPDVRMRALDDLARRVGLELPPGEAYRHWRELTMSDWKVRLGGRRPPLDGPALPFQTFRDIWTERSRQLLARWGVDGPLDLGYRAYRDAHSSAVLYSDVAPALAALRGRYRVALLSDADNDFLKASMKRNGLSFETVVTSEDQRANKPHISMFREVCSRLDVEPSDAVYVGDSVWSDIEGARHAGLRAVWVNRHGAPWPEEVEPPHAEVTSLEELETILEGLA
jgi:2-haloacid dehalogenase